MKLSSNDFLKFKDAQTLIKAGYSMRASTDKVKIRRSSFYRIKKLLNDSSFEDLLRNALLVKKGRPSGSRSCYKKLTKTPIVVGDQKFTWKVLEGGDGDGICAGV